MKKWGIVAGIVVVLGLGAGAWWWMMAKPADTPANQNTTGGSTYSAKDACTLLTQAVADAVLGAGAKKGEGNTTTSSGDVSVSTCTYTGPHDDTLAGIKNMKTATVLVRSPMSAAGETSNKAPFSPAKASAQTVAGYGDMAFWDPAMGQLNVYKKGTWVILSIGVATPSAHTLDDSKKLADRIIPNL